MTKRNDQIFQLSLTEIAFTLCFILLLLLGYLVFIADKETEAAKAELAIAVRAGSTKTAIEQARHELKLDLASRGVSNPDEVVSKMIDAAVARAENQRLHQQVEELDAKLTALSELKERLNDAAAKDGSDETADTVASALAMQRRVREVLDQQREKKPAAKADATKVATAATAASAPPASNASSAQLASSGAGQGEVHAAVKSAPDGRRSAKDLSDVVAALTTAQALKSELRGEMQQDIEPGKERETVAALVSAAKAAGGLSGSKGVAQVSKENTDLRGQVAFLKGRLDARGGRDYPPCWADETGRVEFLFSVEVRPEGVVVTPAWPARREAAAKALPGIADALASPYSNQEFVRRIQGIFEWSKHQDPECRHYVELKSSIPDAIQSDRARLMVENYFYKSEVRR